MRSGQGADLVMVDVALDIKSLITSLARERITVPVIGCGIGNDTEAAVLGGAVGWILHVVRGEVGQELTHQLQRISVVLGGEVGHA